MKTGYIEGYYGKELSFKEREGLMHSLADLEMTHYFYCPKEDPYHRMQWKEDYDPVKQEHYENKENIHPYYFIRELSKKMTSNDVFVVDCGGNVVICNHAFETKKGQRYFSNNGNSPMGFSFSGALGAYFGDKTRQVVCVTGDGGMNMNIQELQTIKNYNIKNILIEKPLCSFKQNENLFLKYPKNLKVFCGYNHSVSKSFNYFVKKIQNKKFNFIKVNWNESWHGILAAHFWMKKMFFKAFHQVFTKKMFFKTVSFSF